MFRKKIEEIEQDKRDKQIIDLRSPEEYEKDTYPGAVNLFWEELEEHRDEIAQDKPVYLICYTGQKSDEIAENLVEQGYEAYSIQNGFHSYLRLKLQRMMEQGEEPEINCKYVERSIVKRFRKEIWRPFVKGINEYDMIQDGGLQSVSPVARIPC